MLGHSRAVQGHDAGLKVCSRANGLRCRGLEMCSDQRSWLWVLQGLQSPAGLRLGRMPWT